MLTYVPHLPSGYKVQMGNIGMHYYEWRYLGAGGSGGPSPATPTSVALPPKANITIDGIAYRKTLVDLNGNFCTITNAGQTPVQFDGWWLDSPKWDHVDRFYFPKGVVLAPGAHLNIHAGHGINTTGELYMNRTAIMWDGAAYDLAVLYDNFGREVVRYFPAAEVGATPTAPPAPPTLPPGVATATPPKGTPTTVVTPGATTTAAPSPQPTSAATLPAGATPTATPKP